MEIQVEAGYSKKWVEALRSYIGVPFLHQGRTRAGLDCIGLLAVAARDIGLGDGAVKLTAYDRTPDNRLFAKRAGDFLERKPYTRLQPLHTQLDIGDVLLFWIEKKGYPRHIAVYTGTDEHGRLMIIHSYAKQSKNVIEMPMNLGYWEQRIDSVWRLPTAKG